VNFFAGMKDVKIAVASPKPALIQLFGSFLRIGINAAAFAC
jgi:hypothetical protein